MNPDLHHKIYSLPPLSQPFFALLLRPTYLAKALVDAASIAQNQIAHAKSQEQYQQPSWLPQSLTCPTRT